MKGRLLISALLQVATVTQFSTAGQIISVGGSRSQSHESPQTSKENNFGMHVSQEKGPRGI